MFLVFYFTCNHGLSI